MINYLPPILTYKIFTILLFVAFQCVTLVNAQECGVVYVTPNGSSSGVAGTKANPANLNYGLQLASPQNPLIKISTGAYSISSPLIIRDSLILEGGYLPTMGWAKTNKDSTVITRTNANIEANPERIVAVKCENIKGFKIKDLRIVVQSATNNGVSLYGVYLNSCRNYNLTRVWVRTGRAGDGVNGVNGVNGANGADGTMGGLGTPYEPNVTGTYMVDIFNDIPQNGSASPYTVDGGNGGNSWSVGSNSGGNGGDGGLRGVGTNCLPGFTCANSDPCNSQNGPINAPDGQNGLSGNGIGAGSGGPGKLGYNFCAFNQGDQVEIVNFLLSCPSTDTAVYRGANGLDGTDGINGLSGTNGIAQFANGYFQPQNGTDGEDGTSGSGGGGGGGGASIGGVPRLGIDPVFNKPVLPDMNTAGAGGGGGGEGGQRGTKGTGGTAGGGNFSIFVWNNGPGGVIKDCNLKPGKAALAGKGGSRGIGGAGGNGGKGGSDVLYGVGPSAGAGTGCKGGAGGDGGKGGKGGNGGLGGDGSDGVSMGIWQDPNGQQVFLIQQFNPFEAPITVKFGGCANTDVEVSVEAPNANVINWFLNGIPSSAIGSTAQVEYPEKGYYSLSVLIDGVPYSYPDFVYIDKSFQQPKIVYSTPTICVGGSIDFSTNSPGDEYIWKFQGASITTSSLKNAGTVTFANVGTYFVELQTNSCCGLSRIDTLKVNVIPSVEINLSSNDTICKFDSPYPVLNATALPGATYSWKLNSQTLSQTTPTLQTNQAGIYQVTVSYGNCSGSASYQLTTFDSLVIDLGADVMLCGNEPPPLLDPKTNGASYIWSRNGQIISTEPVFQVVLPGNYKVSVVSQSGCFGSDEISIFRSEPIVKLGDDRFLCPSGGQSVLDAGNPNASYEWKRNGVVVGSSRTYTVTQSGTYQITIIDPMGCQATDEVVITLGALIDADFDMPTSTIVGQTVNFSDLSTPNPNFWQWNFGDGVLSADKNPTHVFTTAGKRNVFLVTGNGVCFDTIIKQIDVLWDCNQLGLKADFISGADTIDLNSVGSVFFTNTSLQATEWNWNFGNNKSSNSINGVTSYSEEGVYSVKLVVRNYNCADSITKTIVVIQVDDTSTTSINDFAFARRFKVYPNPAYNEIILEGIDNSLNDAIDIKILNMQGQELFSKQVNHLNTNSTRLDLQALAKGIYFLRVSNSSGNFVKKFTKQ